MNEACSEALLTLACVYFATGMVVLVVSYAYVLLWLWRKKR